MMKLSRKPDIMADAAYIIISSVASKTNANFFIDDHVLRSHGTHDLKKYQCDQTIEEH